jgi:hypothetical protein
MIRPSSTTQTKIIDKACPKEPGNQPKKAQESTGWTKAYENSTQLNTNEHNNKFQTRNSTKKTQTQSKESQKYGFHHQ